MKKLFVDDLRKTPNDTWMAARTVTEAIRLLHFNHFEQVSLDHDIVDSDETFMPVAMYLAARWVDKSGNQFCPTITIHTGNPVGSEKMHEVLRIAGLKSYCIPYKKEGLLAPPNEPKQTEVGT